MVIAVIVIAFFGWLDDRRESEAALEDFSQEQATLAVSLGGQLRARLDGIVSEIDAKTTRHGDGANVIARHVRRDAPPRSPERPATAVVHVRGVDDADATEVEIALGPLFSDASHLARPGESRILVMPPGENALVSPEGARIDAPALASALRSGATTLRLDRTQAAALGFPARTAIAGLANVDGGALGRWGVAMVTSARRERDRQQRASVRLVGGVTLAGGLVFLFGAIALSKQRRELELARELEVAALTKQRDERLVRADRVAVMGTLATGVAHEISTPLAVITGRTEQLLAKEDDARSRRHLEVIHEQTARIGAVVRGFMDLARGGAPVLAAIAPSQIVRAAVRLTEHRLLASGMHLATDVAEAIPEVHCDHRLLEHAVVNLLLNACAACERGGHVDLTVRTDGTHVGFVVDDDGVGITPEATARAMEPFFTTKPVGEGTGLGLAITHEIVKAHHGTLTIAPRPTGGTRAVISIPIVAKRAEQAAE
jgi:signal transduction histidine kinase